MKTNIKRIILAVAVGSVFASPGLAMAEVTSATGPVGTLSTTARQDFQVIIPRFLQFRVGATAGTISLVDCDMTANAAVLGNAVNQACAGGDAGAGVSNVSVISNAGQITLTATTLGQLQSGANNMPFSEIVTNTSSAFVPAPTLPAMGGVSPTVNVAMNAAPITNRQATWTYGYANTTVYAPGTYGGVNVQNGRATYTASSP
jgi:hypothetical protein